MSERSCASKICSRSHATRAEGRVGNVDVEFLLGLLTEVPGIDKKEDTLGISVFVEQQNDLWFAAFLT
jgi:hypothetical protein